MGTTHIRLLSVVLAFWGITGICRAQSVSVWFGHGSAQLSETESNKIRQALKAAPGSDVEWFLEGRTSSSGSEALNLDLSRRRSETVKQLLAGWGVSPAQIREHFTGETLATQNADLPEERVVIIRFEKSRSHTAPDTDAAPDIPGTPVSVSVVDAVTRQRITGTAYPQGLKETSFDTSGLRLRIARGGSLSLRLRADGFRDSSFVITGDNPVPVLELMPMNVKEKLSFANILFYPNTPQIVPESMRVLEELLGHLQKTGPKVKIVVRGHVNWPNSPETSPAMQAGLFDLSEKRAYAVLSWLVRKGIARERLSAIGLGYSQMLFPFAETEGEMAQNRRVEILLIDP